MEADNDFNKIRQAKIYKEINTRNCYVLSNTLELAKLSLSDKYFKIRDVKGTELILYTIKNQIFIPKCEEIEHIEIVMDSKICFTGIPIVWYKNEENGTGFLSTQKIILKSSTRVSCENYQNDIYIEIDNGNKVLRRTGANITISDNIKQHESIQIINRDIEKLNFNHYSIITENIEINTKLLTASINDNKFLYTYAKETPIDSFNNNLSEFLITIERNWFTIRLIMVVVTIITIIISVSLTIFCIKNSICCKGKKKTRKIIRNVNLMEAFLPEPVQLNSITTRSNTSLDQPTKQILETIRRQKRQCN